MATPAGGSNGGPFGIPPGGPWFVNPVTGTIQRQSNPALAIGLVTAGWIGFATQADAKNYASNNPIGQAKGAVGSAVSGATSGISAVGDFFNKLSEANTWLRVAEALLGVVLIAVALGKLTGLESSVKNAANTAVKVAK